MAYTTKWFSEFADDSGNVYIVEILERDYAGDATEVLSGGRPVFVERMSGGDPYEVIRSLKFSFEWISDDVSGFEITDLFITDDRKYRFKLSEYVADEPELLFTGYLVFIDCQEPYNSKPYPVTISATCSLPFIRDDFFLDEFGSFVQGKLSLIKILANCLSSTGLELPIYSRINLFDEGMTYGAVSALAQAEIDADGLRGKKGGEVLEGILGAMGAAIVQSYGRWYLIDVRAQDSYLADEWRFDYQGNATGFSTVRQAASFGRTPFNEFTPNVFPVGGIGGVNVSLAEPNSIVTVSVEPGIQVNRLQNGTFSGPVIGGQIPGWRKAIEGGTSWSRDGSGTPDDPYRLAFRSFVSPLNKAKQNKFRPLSYFETGPIEINVGDFFVSALDRKDVKVVFTGAVRMNNVFSVTTNLNLNENERDYASYLNESGEWLYSKKEDTEVTILSNVRTVQPVKTYEELQTQTFEVVSQEVTNLIKVGSDGKAYIRLRIFPGVQFENYIGPEVFASYEDLAVIIDTGLVFEGDHKYQVDGKLDIRDANSIEYTIIIADKTGIDTPENGRAVNRVMTGYMTIAGGNVLTSGWVRYVDGSPDSEDSEPDAIQKKVLREKVRLFCGKRRVYEGSFQGHGLMPIHSVFNRFEDPGAPQTFHTITEWKWDVKEMTHQAEFFELDFTKLDEEEVYLLDENGGRRGNRQYSGGSTSSSGNGGATGSKPVEQIVLDDPDTYQYVAGQIDENYRVCDVGALIQSTHIPADLDAKIIIWPPWITAISVNTGLVMSDPDIPDDGLLEIVWKGKPTVPGAYQIVVELENAYGADYLLTIPIYVNGIPVVKFSLLDTTVPKIVGALPGAYKLPEMWDARALVDGLHNSVELSISGPTGVLMNDAIPAPGFESDSGSYRAFQDTDGIMTGPGLFKLTFKVIAHLLETFSKIVFFTLYTEEFLAKLKFELWNAAKIGDISIQDDSKFKYQEWFDVKVIIEDSEHDEAIITILDQDDNVIHENTITHLSPVTTIDYFLYGSPQTGQLPGGYRVNVKMKLAGEVVNERQNDFTILPKPKSTEAGIALVLMRPNEAAYDEVMTLPISGVTMNLPERGFNAVCKSVGAEVDYLVIEYLRKAGGQLADFDLTKYTKRPSYITLPAPTLEFEALVFDTLSSLEIGDIHQAPSTHRFRVTGRLGGAEGVIQGVAQGDVTFRVPVPEGDLSGLRFGTINRDTGAYTLIDPNMPPSGGKYQVPAWPEVWTVSFRKLKSGGEFDNGHVSGKQNGVELVYPGTLQITNYPVTVGGGYPGNVTTELKADDEVYVRGNVSGEHRELNNPSAVAVNIDVPALWDLRFLIQRFGVPVGLYDVSFELVDELPETPEEEGDGCCCNLEPFDFTNQTVWNVEHNLNKKPDVNIIIDGEKVWAKVEYPDNNNLIVRHLDPETGSVEIC